jgi:hypothetical protein
MIKVNQASLAMQSDQDYEQIMLVDNQERGIAYANRLMADSVDRIKGEYVLILDDDDLMINAEGIATLRLATKNKPVMVIFRGWINGLIPSDDFWLQPPRMGQIGVFCYILRADIFREHSQEVGRPEYHNDYLLVKSVYERHEHDVAWKDRLICMSMRRSNERPE